MEQKLVQIWVKPETREMLKKERDKTGVSVYAIVDKATLEHLKKQDEAVAA